MIRNLFMLAGLAFIAACSPARPAGANPQALASPSDSWDLKMTQSGGIAGVLLNVHVSSDGRITAEDVRTGRMMTRALPVETVATLSQLVTRTARATSVAPRPSHCADCFIYDLEVVSAGRMIHIQADDTTLEASGAADLIRFLGKLRDQALRS